MTIFTSVFSFTRVHHVFALRHSDETDKHPKDYDLRESCLMSLSAMSQDQKVQGVKAVLVSSTHYTQFKCYGTFLLQIQTS